MLSNLDWKESQWKELESLFNGYEVSHDADDREKLADTEVIIHWNKKMSQYWQEGLLPNLKWVQAISAGINSMPLEGFEQKGIILTNASGLHQSTISEFVIGALLFHMRGFQASQANQQQKVWEQSLDIRELKGKTMMIFGIGNIGRRLARIADAFGMQTIGVNRSGREVEEVNRTVTQDECDQVLGEADIVVNILPETEETRNFFDEKRFSKMKKSTLFVNVGRGTSVETAALIKALNEEILSFAALDVFENEPLEIDSPLWEHPKVFISPHVSGTLEHFRDELFEIVKPNVSAYVSEGSPVKNIIDYKTSY